MMATQQPTPRMQRSNSTFGKPMPKSGKLPVADPSSFSKFFVILVMHVCKKIILIRTNLKVAYYMVAITCGSLFFDLIPAPPTYFARKDNFLNWFFVRMGWGWTLLVTGAYVFLTSYTYTCGNRSLVRQHLTRLALATCWWYSATSFFNYIDNMTGFCSVDGIRKEGVRSKHKCIELSGGWYSFDISGHAFLLIFNLLVISEEVKSINGWERILEFIQTEEDNPSKKLSGQERSQLRLSYTNLTPLVRVNIAWITAMQLVFEFMLWSTIMYFHNLPQKFLAACFAVFGWFFIYQVLCRTNICVQVGTTGKEPHFKFIKQQ